MAVVAIVVFVVGYILIATERIPRRRRSLALASFLLLG
jgi:hypothetical protein